MTTTIVATIFVFGLLIFFHEVGHFFTAKLVGMQVDEFAIGFGPKLLSWKSRETLYSLRIIPLGGYNKIAGMDPDEEQNEHSFNRKPIWSRILVIVAGSAMNFILPVLLFFLVFISAGIDTPSNQPLVGSVITGKPAAQAGMLAGDRILAIDGEDVASWRQFVGIVQQSTGKSLAIDVERAGQQYKFMVVPEFDAGGNRGIVGITPQITNYRPGIIKSAGLAVKQTYLVGMGMLAGLMQMITGQVAAEVAGPIGVAQMAGEIAQLGFVPLVQFAAFLSINLGLINLFPIPVLDGGHVVALAVEGLRGRPLNRDKMQFIQMVGFMLLMLLLIVATFKDITKLNLF